ncbi:MATH and LRR domain-containing protein PFE0570w-like [Microplitis mediator]|uniref:MATH and LRR domain-containing protein PFE0570w-like n=1 Tax=Microplitis mediator TaxID=375433 RepID=UPI002557B562|nr:MATH and LRR domain-containing protein PFE0570w-like [Microplitis mediator]
MRWQIGGNIRPVRLVCELNWKECPYAVLNYMWSEIVTDVVDCVTNESILLRIIILLLVSTILVHTIWSRLKSLNESVLTKDTLNDVGYKLQDLELRVNILTYKMQYGTWPLPEQIKGTSIEGHKQNIRLTLSDNRSWLNKCIKNTRDSFSMRVRKPKTAETKRINYGHDANDKLHRRKSDKSLTARDKNDSRLKSASAKSKSSRESINSSLTSSNDSLDGSSKKSLNNNSIYPVDKIFKSSQKPATTKESLADVQQRLEKLQNVLKTYSQDNLLIIKSKDNDDDDDKREFRDFLKELSDLRTDTESDDNKLDADVDNNNDKLIINDDSSEGKDKITGSENKNDFTGEGNLNKCEFKSNEELTDELNDSLNLNGNLVEGFNETETEALKRTLINEFYLENNLMGEDNFGFNSQLNFTQSKLLDIINEEQSGSSCTEKISKTMICFKKISQEAEILDAVEGKNLIQDESLELIQELRFNETDLDEEVEFVGKNCGIGLEKWENFDELSIARESSELVNKLEITEVNGGDEKLDGLMINENKNENELNIYDLLEIKNEGSGDKKLLEEKINMEFIKSNEDLIDLNDDAEIKIDNEKIKDFDKFNLIDSEELDDFNLSDEPLTARTIINENKSENSGDIKNLIELEQLTFEALTRVESSWDTEITKTISEASTINFDSLDEDLKLNTSEIKSLNVLSKESSVYLTVDSISDLSVDKSLESGDKINLLEPDSLEMNENNFEKVAENSSGARTPAEINKSSELTSSLSDKMFQQNIYNSELNLSCDKSNGLINNPSDKMNKKSRANSLTGIKSFKISGDGEKNGEKILNTKINNNSQKTRSNLNLTRDNEHEKGERRVINLQRRSKSYVTPRKVEASPRINTGNANKLYKFNSRSRESMNKLSKSCIPVLKTRLESKKDDCRPKSPARGPLTVSVSLENSKQNIPVITEGAFCRPVVKRGNSAVDSEAGGKRHFEVMSDKNKELIMKDQTIIYVNVVTDSDNCVTKVIDPKTFLEFIKDRELNVQEVIDKSVGENNSDNSEDKNKNSKIITVVSSAINSNNNNSNSNSSNNNSNNNNFVCNKLKEKEVLAKPSIAHTSTSISDLSGISKLKLPVDHKRVPDRPSNLNVAGIENIFKRKNNKSK